MGFTSSPSNVASVAGFSNKYISSSSSVNRSKINRYCEQKCYGLPSNICIMDKIESKLSHKN